MSNNGFARKLYRKALEAVSVILGPKRAKALDSELRFGRHLDLDNPKTLADKISWIELNGNQARAAQCTDKYAVREFIEEKGLESILIPVCGGPWSDASQIDLSVLPEQFVLKATHGCEMNYICKNKAVLNVEDMLACAQEWLSIDYPRSCVEPHYKLIPHRIYVEEYVGGIDDTVDYKFHCINGVPRFILTCSNRERSLKLNLYDLCWEPIPGLQGPMRNDKEIPKPSTLSRMLEVSKRLAEDFDFVRIDLYEKNNKVYFGEMTFSPASGVLPYFTDEFIRYWGNILKIS